MRTVFDPSRGHGARGGIHVVPGDAIEDPAAGLRAREGVVVPVAPLEDPAGAHVAVRVEAVHLAIDGLGSVRGVGTVRVAIPPAAHAPRPLAAGGHGVRGVLDGDGRRGDDVGILTHVEAQDDVGAGRGPGVGGSGRALIRAALHRIPVLENRLRTVAADLHHAHLTSTQGAALRGDVHGRRSAHGGGERVPRPGLVDARTRDRDLGGRVLKEGRRVVASVLHGRLGKRPCLRALGGGDVDLGTRLEVIVHVGGELDLLDGRGQHQDAGRVEPEGESCHPLAEVGAVRAAVGGLALVVELAVVTAVHDDVARGGGLPRSHPQFRDLRAQLDRVQAVAHQASGHGHRVGDDNVGEVRVAIEGAISDGCHALGQNDAA